MAKYIELRPDSKLIDTHFDCYKLSLEVIPVFSKELSIPVYRVSPNDDQYSLLHAKLFALHNHIFYDYWNDDKTIYFIDKNWSVQKCSADIYTNEIKICKVWDIPKYNGNSNGRYNVTIMFVTKTLAVVGDGVQILYLVNTGNRNINEPWNALFHECVLGDGTNFVIADVRNEILIDGLNSVNCVLMYIDKNETSKTHYTILKWLTLNESVDGTWKVFDTRTLHGKGEIHYCALEKGSKAIYVGSDNKLNFIDENIVKDELNGGYSSSKYDWQQTENDITITIGIDKSQDKNCFRVNSTETDLNVHYQEKLIVSLKLWSGIDPDITTWNIDIEDKLCVMLIKSCKSIWPILTTDDLCESVILNDPNKVTEEKPEPIAPSFNSQQLEECDMAPDKSAILERFCKVTYKSTHCAGLETHQVLFTLRMKPEEHPILTLRHDVDGCLWQPEVVSGETWNIQHIGTLSAFGYIQASKEQKKFETCCPDLSYSVICESNRHLFIYRQRRTVTEGCELRNRNRGQNIGTFAQQQVINLVDGEVLGIHALNNSLFVLTENKISIFKI